MDKRLKFIRGFLFVSLVVLATFSVSATSTLTLWPDGQGYYSSWTNSGCDSSSEWQCVNGNPVNTSVNLYTSSKNIYESFTFQDTGLVDKTINRVTLYFYGQRYSITRYQFQPLIRANSINYLGSVKSLTLDYAYSSQDYPTNPATGTAWTIAQVDALEAGMKSYSANYGGRIAQMYAVVNYSIPNSCSDTDGGLVELTQGTTSGYYLETSYSDSDYCLSDTVLKEYYCYGGNHYSFNVDCSGNYTGCVNGACY